MSQEVPVNSGPASSSHLREPPANDTTLSKIAALVHEFGGLEEFRAALLAGVASREPGPVQLPPLSPLKVFLHGRSADAVRQCSVEREQQELVPVTPKAKPVSLTSLGVSEPLSSSQILIFPGKDLYSVTFSYEADTYIKLQMLVSQFRRKIPLHL